jgi:hypothetical protein
MCTLSHTFNSVQIDEEASNKVWGSKINKMEFADKFSFTMK